MARTKKPLAHAQPTSSIHTVSLTTEEVRVLGQLSRGASDFLGRSISNSAVVRALIRQIGKQGPSEADALFLEIERELHAGVLWGRKRKKS